MPDILLLLLLLRRPRGPMYDLVNRTATQWDNLLPICRWLKLAAMAECGLCVMRKDAWPTHGNVTSCHTRCVHLAGTSGTQRLLGSIRFHRSRVCVIITSPLGSDHSSGDHWSRPFAWQKILNLTRVSLRFACWMLEQCSNLFSLMVIYHRTIRKKK